MMGMKRVLLIFKVFMVFVYISLGVMILFFNVLPLSIGSTGKTIFGIIFVLYGLFRLYSFYKAFTEEPDEE